MLPAYQDCTPAKPEKKKEQKCGLHTALSEGSFAAAARTAGDPNTCCCRVATSESGSEGLSAEAASFLVLLYFIATPRVAVAGVVSPLPCSRGH